MTAVVVLGDIPTAGIIRQASAGRMPVDAAVGSEAALDFVAYAGQGLRERKAVLALYPAWRSAAAVRFVQQARGMLESDRIAGVPLDLPPLAFSLVADQLSYLAQHVSPGLLASLAHRLPLEVLAGAWVNSVTKLEHIRTSLGKHVTSYLPGTGFMVAAAPYPSIHRITSGQPVAQLAYRPADPVLMLAAHEDGGTDWLKDKLAPAIAPQSLNIIGVQPLSAEFWGTKKYLEFVAFSGHPHALQYSITATPCRPCPWCEEPTALPTCPFCLMVQPVPQAAEPPRQQDAPPSAPATQPEAPAPHVPSARPVAEPQVHAASQPTTYRPQPPSAQPTQSWYEQQSPPHGVPPPSAGPPAQPPAQDQRSSAQEDRQATSGERSQTVTFAVPQSLRENGAKVAAPVADSTPSSNGVSAPQESDVSTPQEEAEASAPRPQST